MARQSAFFVSFAFVISTAFGCSGSSSSTSTSSTGGGGSTTGSGSTTGASGQVAAPTLTPKGGTLNNDVNVVVEAETGATICYRTDGTKPTCDLTTAACTSGSLLYDSVAQIPVTGAVTTAATGSVTVEAIACQPNRITSLVVPVTYTLQVAAPTMSTPAGGSTLAFDDAKPSDPLVSTATNSSTSNVQIWYTVGAPPAAAPTCSSGAGPIPATGNASSGLISTAAGGIQSFTSSTTFQVIGCKQGYLPSAVTPIAYTVQLNPPTILAVNSTEDGGFWPASVTSFDYNATFQVDDTLNVGSSDYLCVVIGSTPPACDTGGACDAGTMLATGGTIGGSLHIANATAYTEPILGVACGNSALVPSTVVTGGPYSLLLDRVTSNPASGTAIPSGSALQLTLEQSPGDPSDPDPSAAPKYDYICWTEDSTTTPSCNSDCPQSVDGSIDGVLLGLQHSNGTSVALPSSGAGSLSQTNFPSGVTLFAVGCLNSTPPPAVIYGPSPVSNIVVSP